METRAARTDGHPQGAVVVELSPEEVQRFNASIDEVLDALRELDPEREFSDQGRVALAELSGQLGLGLSRLAELPPARVPDDRPTDPAEAPVHEQGEADDTAVDLPRYLDIVASHVLPANREFTVRVYRCDNSGRRDPNETLAKTFADEAKARDFYGRTQNIWNMRVRGGEAPAFDVVLGVQDSRKHAKKKSYRELEHSLCKGGQP